MSCQKRKADKEEKEQSSPSSSKRACFHEDSSSPNKRTSVHAPQKTIKSYTEQERKRVLDILEAEFDKELQAKEEEALEIQERIHKTQRILQYLCYAVVSDFYSREKTITSVASTRQRRIHPAVKKLLSGKGPPGAPEFPPNNSAAAESASTAGSSNSSRHIEVQDDDILARVDSPSSCDSSSGKEKKVPRYIPPKPKPKTENQSEPVRGGQNKVKTILVVGNVSKWLPLDMRDDSASHKWMVYVRGPKGEPDISSFVSKVRFFLHPSYRPNDVVQVVCPPFQLSRRGWGEFPVRVQVHFNNSLNKPVDIIHNLKLDRTHCGLQTLGSETVAEVWIHRELPQAAISNEEKSDNEQHPVKLEPIDIDENSLFTSEETDCITSSNSSGLLTSSKKDAEKRTHSVESSKNIEQNVKTLEPVPLRHPSETHPEKHQQVETDKPLLEGGLSVPFQSTSSTASGSKSMCPTTSVPLSSAEASAKPSSLQNVTESVIPVDQSPSKHGVSCTPENIPVPQKLQVSPTKAGTQLVKCVDSKGTVRLLQVRTDLLPKILQRGTTTIPATPPGLPNVSSKANVDQSSASVLPPSPEKQVVPQTPVPPQANAMQVLPLKTNAPILTSSSPVKIQSMQSGTPLSPGVRPVLRLVRPPGSVNARPMLLAQNLNSRQIIRLPASAAGNGSRPLLVMKDGKLFMMKSALNSAVNSSISPVVISPSKYLPENSSSQNECIPNASSAAVAKTIDPSSTNKMTPAISSVMTTNIISTNSTSSKPMDVKISEMIPSTSNRLPTLAINAGIGLKPRSSATIPSLVRFPTPKPVIIGDTPQTANKTNVVHPECLSQPQSLINSAIPKVAVKPGKSLLKSAVSVLKSNVGISVLPNKNKNILPASSTHQTLLKTLSSQPSTVPQYSCAVEGSTTTKRIILGRTSGSSSITPYSQQSILYRERLRSTVQACPKGPEENVWQAIRWMMKNLPLIHEDAKHLEFKILHPYCAPDESTFCSWNIGKQRACEWQRAKTVRSLLKDAGWDLLNVWSTREIILWARFHGYTPGLPILKNPQPRTTLCGGSCENPIATICKFGKISTVEKWLAAHENLSTSSKSQQCHVVVSLSDESDEEVDVLSSFNSPSKAKVKQEPITSSSQGIVEGMTLEPSLHTLGDMVTKSLKRIGIRLASEEIVPGVHYPAAQRMLVEAVKSLAEDLARRAFADAWSKDDISRRPGSIETSNICSAICHRPEFDIFTCAGLGITSISDTLPASGK